MVRAVIFDMDGLLVDSEPWWQRAQWEVFTALGVPVTEAAARDLVGLRTADHIAYWYARHPWSGPSHAEVAGLITARALALIREHGAVLPGARDAVTALAGEGIPLAVASSSASSVIAGVLGHVGLRPWFDVLQSAEFEPHGKPHPGVYCSTARRLGVDPADCLAIEDSVTGVTAAKAAGMACIAVPGPGRDDDPRYRIADRVIPSLEGLDAACIRDVHAAFRSRLPVAAR